MSQGTLNFTIDNDYYCLVTAGLYTHKTKRRQGNDFELQFRETFRLGVIESTNHVKVELMDQDFVRDDEIGSIKVEIQELKRQDRWYDLTRRDKKVGEIRVVSTFDEGRFPSYFNPDKIGGAKIAGGIAIGAGLAGLAAIGGKLAYDHFKKPKEEPASAPLMGQNPYDQNAPQYSSNAPQGHPSNYSSGYQNVPPMTTNHSNGTSTYNGQANNSSYGNNNSPGYGQSTYGNSNINQNNFPSSGNQQSYTNEKPNSRDINNYNSIPGNNNSDFSQNHSSQNFPQDSQHHSSANIGFNLPTSNQGDPPGYKN